MNLKLLAEMTGADSVKSKGFRNFGTAAVGSPKEAEMMRLVAAGLASKDPGEPVHPAFEERFGLKPFHYYRATRQGCRALGFDDQECKRAGV